MFDCLNHVCLFQAFLFEVLLTIFVAVLQSAKQNYYPGTRVTRVVLKEMIDHPGSEKSSILDTLVAAVDANHYIRPHPQLPFIKKTELLLKQC